jgi:hypothetical protein
VPPSTHGSQLWPITRSVPIWLRGAASGQSFAPW